MYKIPKELADIVVNYLASKPYVEVFKMIEGLSKLEETKEEVKDIKTSESGVTEI